MLSVLRYVRGLFGRPAAAGLSDGQLLEAFAQRRDEGAFAALVARHGPLVWGVCRRALGDADAEDAFQATFLVLARKAGSVRWQDEVGGWLYAVALRVVGKARTQAARRRLREKEAAMLPPAPAALPDDELRAVLDEEIGRLPEKYRRAVVLCYLEGRTYTEAAGLLGWKEGTVSGRLARARELLRGRLARRGLAPSEAALAALLTASVAPALPPGLAESTVQASLSFVAGTVNSGSAALLADGVLQTMFLTRLKIAAACVLLLAVAGVGVGVAATLLRGTTPRATTAPPGDDPPAEKPPLPKAWAGRWEADPFAGVVAFEVRHQAHGGGNRVYHIKDPAAVAALVKTATVEGVDNDIAAGVIPPAFLIIRRKDGSSVEPLVMSDGRLHFWNSIMTVGPNLIPALNERLSRQEGRPVDITEFLPANPAQQPGVAPAEPKVTVDSLKAGFAEIAVDYIVAGHLHRARITDAATLKALHREVNVLGTRPFKTETARGRDLALVLKDGVVFYARMVSPTEWTHAELGLLTVAPEFGKALNKEVSRREGYEVDVWAVNRLPEALVRRGAELGKLLAGVKAIQFSANRPGGKRTIKVDDAGEVAKLLGGVRVIGSPAREFKAEGRTPLLELTTKDGRKVEVAVLDTGIDNEKIGAGPGLSDLVEVGGLGQFWVSSGWKTQVRDHAYIVERREKEQRDLETTGLVCADLPTFLRHVLNVVANYRDGDSQLRHMLTATESRPVLRALAAGRLEKLAWNKARWQHEVGGLIERGAGVLALNPGLGFSLMVVVKSEKELLVMPHGRLVFATSPLPALTKALGEEAKAPRLLPGK